MDTHSWVLWVGIVAAGLHVFEEYVEGWVAWVNQTAGPRLGFEVSDADFFLGAALLLFTTLAGAAIGWWAPAVSLAIPALFVINAIFFHMLPSIRGDRLTPGTLSAVFIYLPVAAWMYWAAGEDGQLGAGTVLLSLLLGAALLVYPVAVLAMRDRLGWNGDGERPTTDEQPTTGEQPESRGQPTD
ncbi:MAG: HXXEE domain-containing protein [Solirubrobacterales bacterium]|nr:HXXEE domain-containing protein [Solirubrobacterales bacterium]